MDKKSKEKYIAAEVLSELIKSDNLDDLVEIDKKRNTILKKRNGKIYVSKNKRANSYDREKIKEKKENDMRNAIANLMRRGIW